MNDGWVTGDRIKVAFPAHPAALRDGGVTFLTNAFHASGALGGQNRVARIALCEEVPGGSTGRKLVLDVEYEEPQPGLPIELFVKFSRDFDDPIPTQGSPTSARRQAGRILASRTTKASGRHCRCSSTS